MYLHGLVRRLRRLAPRPRDEAIAADDVAGVEEELGEHGALLRPAEREHAILGPSLEGPEDGEFHAASSSPS